jgi:hypothetical protein
VATPTFDARQGLFPEVLQDLQQVHRVALALKDRRTAVLGYWIRVHSPGGQGTDKLRAVLLPAQVHAPTDQDLSTKCPVIIDLTRGTAEWEKAVERLKPGDVMTVDWDWREGTERAGWVVDRAKPTDIHNWHAVHLHPTWEVRLRRASSTLMTLLLNPHPS